MTAPVPFGSGADPAGRAAQSPPGPGVAPPFAAPPTDRSYATLWIGLGVGALVLVLCCVGGIFGLGALAATGVAQVKAEARTTVTRYLTALKEQRYDAAYSQLCPDLADQQTRTEFAAAQRDAPRVVDFSIGEAQVGSVIVVPATVQYDGGETRTERYGLSQQGRTATLKVCSVTRR